VGSSCATSTIRCVHLSRSCARLACAVRLTVPSLEVRATLPLIFREGTQGTVSTENRSPGCGKRDRTVGTLSGQIAAWHCQMLAAQPGGEASPRASNAAENL